MRALILLAVLCSACGSSPTAPSVGTPTPSPTPAPPPSTITVSGRVTATNGGQALSGVQAALGAATATTDGSGGFALQLLPSGSLALALTGSGIVPRSVFVAAGSTRSVTVDAIAVAGFDLTFYRQFVRNGLEAPAQLQPLRRWTSAPSIRVRTVDNAGRPVDPALVAMAVRIATGAVPAWTGSPAATIDTGVEARTDVGWLTIGWADHADAGRCGEAVVGGPLVTLYYLNTNCSGGGLSLKPQTVRHELGHAFGFWHTDGPSDAMYGQRNDVVDAPPSSRELTAAAIAYARPVGNLDPDSDPTSAVSLAPMTVR